LEQQPTPKDRAYEHPCIHARPCRLLFLLFLLRNFTSMKLSIALFALLSFFCAVRAAARVCEAVNGDASVSFCSHIQYDVSRPSDLTFAEMDALALSSYLSSRAAFDQDCCKAVSRLDICANFFPKCEAGTTNPLPPCPLYTCSASFSFISSFSPSYMCQAGEPGQCSNATKVTADMSCSCQDGSDKSNAEVSVFSKRCCSSS